MIQLASDTRPGRSAGRPGPLARQEPQGMRRAPAHAWPFPSRPVPRAAAQEAPSSSRHAGGS